jgi:UV DNA damage endonuclease
MSEASSKQVAARLGFCCKYIPPDGDAVLAKGANLATVTMTALSRLAPAAAFDRLSAVVRHSLQALRLQIEHVATRPPIERLHRLQSQMLPGYTHPVCAPLYRDGDLRKEIERGLDTVGSAARRAGIRLGMHPDQFCVLATASTPARKNALAELEYHAEIMRMLGYGSGWHPGGAHINIHGGARQAGIEGFRAGFAQLSDTARNLVTVENEEVSFGLDDLLPLADTLPIVPTCTTTGSQAAASTSRLTTRGSAASSSRGAMCGR